MIAPVFQKPSVYAATPNKIFYFFFFFFFFFTPNKSLWNRCQDKLSAQNSCLFELAFDFSLGRILCTTAPIENPHRLNLKRLIKLIIVEEFQSNNHISVGYQRIGRGG